MILLKKDTCDFFDLSLLNVKLSMSLCLISLRNEHHLKMDIIKKYIHDNTDRSIVLEMHEYGIKPHEIMEFIIESFKPYFQSESLVKEQVIAYLPDYIDSLIYHLAIPINKSMIGKCIKIYWRAKKRNPIECFKAFGYWQDEFRATTSKTISLVNLDQDRTKMSLYEFSEDVFGKIGTLIEACIQPFLKIMLFLDKICRGEEASDSAINQLSLGQIVNQLLKNIDLEHFLIPTPYKLQLNQWRNISKHDKFIVENNKIIGTYNRLPHEKKIVLLKEELWMIFLTINDIYGILKLTHAIFFFDSIESIKPYWNNKDLREESGILTLIQLFNTHGLSVKSNSMSKDRIHFDLCEVRRSIDLEKRIDNLLFLLRPIWHKSRRRYISLHYFDIQGILSVKLEADTSKQPDIFIINANERLITPKNLRKCCTVNVLDPLLS